MGNLSLAAQRGFFYTLAAHSRREIRTFPHQLLGTAAAPAEPGPSPGSLEALREARSKGDDDEK
jgi:hypothetical protein